MQKGLVRFMKLSLEEGLELLAQHTPLSRLGHDFRIKTKMFPSLPPVEVYSTKLATFQRLGVCCQHCGVEAAFFAIEGFQTRNGDVRDLHVNLYGYNEHKDEVIMTSDHVVPKSRGGSRWSLSNRQTLCGRCNSEKGNFTEEELMDGAAPKFLLLPRE